MNFSMQPKTHTKGKNAYDPYKADESLVNKYMNPDKVKKKQKPKKKKDEVLDEWDEFNKVEDTPPATKEVQKKPKTKKKKQNLDDSWENAMNEEALGNPDQFTTYQKQKQSNENDAYQFDEMYNQLDKPADNNDYNLDDYDDFAYEDKPKSLGLNNAVNK